LNCCRVESDIQIKLTLLKMRKFGPSDECTPLGKEKKANMAIENKSAVKSKKHRRDARRERSVEI
jgi:hypothetical protein